MKRKALWALIGVFLFGMLCGVFLDRALLGFRGWGPWGWRGHHEKRQSRLLKILSRKLDLTDAQQARIAPVLRSTWVELEGVRRDAFKRVDRVLTKSADRIRPVLNPEQSEKFEGLLKRFREKRHRRGRGKRRWWKHGKLDGAPGFPDPRLSVHDGSSGQRPVASCSALACGETPSSFAASGRSP